MINTDMTEHNQAPQNTDTQKPDDIVGLSMTGHILIRDVETKQELVNKRSE